MRIRPDIIYVRAFIVSIPRRHIQLGGIKMRDEKLVKLIKISLLSVMAFLLMYIELPIPIFPEFLKIDISDLPALIGAFALGPIAGVIIELFKNILHGMLAGKTAVGELANFLVGGCLVYVAGYVYRLEKAKMEQLLPY
jgi:riboflavin transporter FmnP